MNRYENGKIYTIRSNQSDLFYIGSTCLPLYKRFYKHKSNYKSWLNDTFPYITSFELLKYDDCYIELLEDYPCKNKRELERREGQSIRFYKEKCVNCRIEGRTDKEWREANKESINQYAKEYREANKEAINQYAKEYRDANKELISENNKQYYDANREAINQKARQPYNCQCGSIIRMSDKAKHEKSKKHIAWLNLKQI